MATFMLDPNNGDNKNISTKATFKRRVLDTLGNPVDRAHAYPLLDTSEYEVELEDGTTDRYFANVIAENLWDMWDVEGNQYEIFKEIIDHRKNAQAIPLSDGYDIGPKWKIKSQEKKVGWEILLSSLTSQQSGYH